MEIVTDWKQLFVFFCFFCIYSSPTLLSVDRFYNPEQILEPAGEPYIYSDFSHT